MFVIERFMAHGLRTVTFSLAALVLSTVAAAADTTEATPTLAPGDEVDLSVFARPELSRIYRVRSDGMVSIHVIGPIEAEGLSEAAFELVVEDALMEQFGSSVSATVEVSAWRPVTVSGTVAAPGSVPYVPGLDVRTAIGLAGGTGTDVKLADESDAVQMRVRQEAALIAQFEVRLAGLLAERARLAEELSGDTSDDLTNAIVALVGAQTAEAIARSQAALADAQGRADALVVSASEAQEALAREEALAFDARQGVVGNQLQTIRGALAERESLLERGLATSSGLLDLRVEVDRLRGAELEAVALASAARQKVDRATAGRTLVAANRAQEAATRMATLETEIAETRVQLAESRSFVRDFGGAELLTRRADGTTASTYRYDIYRRDNEDGAGLAAALETPLMPGDLLEVSAFLAEDN